MLSTPCISRRFLLATSTGICLVKGLGGCISFRARPSPGNGSPGKAYQRESSLTFAGLVEAHNRARGRSGLSPLEVNDLLAVVAREHADDMARHRRMAHRGSDGSSPFRRMERAGYRYGRAAENVAAGQFTLDELMSDWMSSPGHRRNILGQYAEIGTGYATDASGTPYWCVTFGTPVFEGSPSRGPIVG
jgi:uncharacterized protein YkwD